MSDWRCVANNPATGVSTWVREEDDGLVVQTRQDVSALLDANQAQRNLAENNWRGDYHSVGRLPAEMLFDPNAAIAEAVRDGDDKWVKRFLNDGDNSKLRTKEGRI